MVGRSTAVEAARGGVRRRALVLTQGDPEGIGPELLLRAAVEGRIGLGDLVQADLRVLEAQAAAIGRDWASQGFAAIAPLVVRDALGRGDASAAAAPIERPEDGEREPTGAPYGQFRALEDAVTRVLQQPERLALVTGPIDKARAKAEGLPTAGHTEWLAQRAGVPHVVMAMIGPRLRVALATVHIPLSEVPKALTIDGVRSTIVMFARALARQAGLLRPRVGVLGVNPHAGERGLLGQEDAEIIAPAIELARGELAGELAAELIGPLPADTAFFGHIERRYDGLVAMYHDQGLAPFKLLHFHDGVNVTLGLPFVRTSPDHGTARDLAGRGVADPRSFFAAIAVARAGWRRSGADA